MRVEDIERLVDDRPEDGTFSVHRDLFSDPALFDLEMRHIFEASWVFVGLAGQAPAPHDFFTGHVGRQPVIVARDAGGALGCFINTCRHRGSILAHVDSGNARHHVCQYHGWAYDSAGKCVSIKDEKHGRYPQGFALEDHDLLRVPRFAEYRGFLFACLNPDVPPLEEHLGESRTFIDLAVDQSAQGLELVPGPVTYVFRGNWKLQVENGIDLYHLDSVHPSMMKVVARRQTGESKNSSMTKNFGDYRRAGIFRGSYTFGHGHAVVWGTNPKPDTRVLYSDIDNVRKRVGEVRANWMLATRNLSLFPNMQMSESVTMQLRVIRPLAVDRTEMTCYMIAPAGEAAAARELRIRQYEDVFNPTGLATQDDNVVYEDCQLGYAGRLVEWQQGYARGTTALIEGPDEHAKELGLSPVTSVSGSYEIQDETVFHGVYREWLRLMKGGAVRASGQRQEAVPKKVVAAVR